jgi:hypothetical protein
MTQMGGSRSTGYGLLPLHVLLSSFERNNDNDRKRGLVNDLSSPHMGTVGFG